MIQQTFQWRVDPSFGILSFLLNSNMRSDVLMKDEHLFTFLYPLGHILWGFDLFYRRLYKKCSWNTMMCFRAFLIPWTLFRNKFISFYESRGIFWYVSESKFFFQLSRYHFSAFCKVVLQWYQVIFSTQMFLLVE